LHSLSAGIEELHSTPPTISVTKSSTLFCAEFSRFTELGDDEEVIRDLFSSIDTDNDGEVSKENCLVLFKGIGMT
jgi:Ca2+-binding EF-hand superfamily protein